MLIRLIINILAGIVLVACASSDSCVKDLTRENFSVTLSKGACMGACPTYSGTVYGDAHVTYNGKQHVQRMGEYAGEISTELLCRLKTALTENGFMELDEDQTKPVMDAPMSVITVSMNGQKHSVKWNIGTPQAVAALQELMIEATHENGDLTRTAESNDEN